MTEPATSHGWADFITAIAVVIAAILQKLDAQKVRKRLEISGKVRDKKLNDIHSLVNGTLAEQKRLNMMQARRIADLTRDPKDISLAEESERIFKEHQERVLRVDIALMPKGDTDLLNKPK